MIMNPPRVLTGNVRNLKTASIVFFGAEMFRETATTLLALPWEMNLFAYCI